MENILKEETAERKISYFDMKETIEWYKNAKIKLPSETKKPFLYCIENENLIELTEQELATLFSLFPNNSRDRSIMRKVIGQPSTWLHKDSTFENPIPTTNETEALSPTSILSSYVDYAFWKRTKIPTADILLYQIPKNIADEKVRKIILSQGFVHTVSHTIVEPALYLEDHLLKFPNGSIVKGLDAVLHFAKLAEKHPPISNYAKAYREDKNKFKSNDTNYNAKAAISEEMCETITACLLGFVFCGEDSKERNPLADRPEIEDFIKGFLNAKLLTSFELLSYK